MFSDEPELATIVVCEDDDATLDLLCDHLAADRYEVLLHLAPPTRCASVATTIQT